MYIIKDEGVNNLKYTPFILAIIILVAMSYSACGSKAPADNPAAAQVGDTIISVKDVESFRNMTDKTLTDKQAVDILIERSILFQESQNQGISVSLQEAKEYSKEQRKIIETSGGEQAREVMNDAAKRLKVSYEKYWDEYAPKGYMRALSEAKMKRKIEDEIQSDLVKNHPDLSPEDTKKMFDKMYNDRINELKVKYTIKYYIQ